jgi:GT2 family glycosyltransferase
MIPMMVVPTLTRHDLLDRMLRSVDCRIGHLVVIDNSGRGIVGGSGPWERMTVLPMPSNLGVAASWNLAIRLAHREPWVLICSDDMWWPVNALHDFEQQSSEDALVVSQTWPHWCAFTIGMRVVQSVGLFDEGYYPAYFEDTDYERRMGRAGVLRQNGPAVHHDNASTLNTPAEGFGHRSQKSYRENSVLYASDRHHGFDPFRWRAQEWS